MDLPDCPPGAEGYEDTVTEQPKKPPVEDSCTKAEQEFQEHLNSLKIKLEDGSTRCMVERRGRDISGKWIYLCFPCAAMCSGESVLQTHISGKKHKTKLSMRNIWPKSIFEEHPYIVSEKGGNANAKGGTTEQVLAKMAEEVDLHNKKPSELELKYNKYRDVRCHIQDTIDGVKAPMIGVEYLIEFPPEKEHYEPSYVCVLCAKQGHPRTIINHMTCFWHRYNFLVRHFSKASQLLHPFRGQTKYREGVYIIMNRLAQRIEDKYGRLPPVNIDKEEYDKDKERIHQWIFKGPHFTEQMGPTFEEVVDVDLITSLHQSNEESKMTGSGAGPNPAMTGNAASRQKGRDRRVSMDDLSDISEDANPRRPQERDDRRRDRYDNRYDTRYKPYDDRDRGRRREEPRNEAAYRTRYVIRNVVDNKTADKDKNKKPPNYEYKVKLAEDMCKSAEESAKKTLAYHEKNPEKHPMYPEEWKKFWNRRYKEIQAEGKDPSKHDFKPEWVVFWTTRMKELHEEELRVNVIEIYRKLCLSPPPPASARRDSKRPHSPERRPDRRPEPERRRSMERDRRRSPPPDHRRRSPERRRSPDHRSRDRREVDFRRERDRERRSPEFRRHSPPRYLRTRSRSPIPSRGSPHRTHIKLDSVRRSRSPLSRREEVSRNRSPQPTVQHPAPTHQEPHTVLVSDEELRPDDGLSPWNSDDSIGSLPDAKSPPRSHSRTASQVSSLTSRSRNIPRPEYGGGRGPEPQDLGPAENVVATLRLLVALEDYLGSLGPKIVDLLTEALKLEKDKANSSEDLLERESAVVLIETAKEKLKGAMQAGLVPPGAHAAVRSAVVRAASTLHEADTRMKKKQELDALAVAVVIRKHLAIQSKDSKSVSAPPPTNDGEKPKRQRGPRVRRRGGRRRGKKLGGAKAMLSAMPAVTGGEVNRAQIAQQMAAALVAQGKTDVSSEELAQLVDAVVGMAEARKREAEVKKKQDARAQVEQSSRPAPTPAKSATASALQMLQSAYDENDKKGDKEDAPDAMDGLSDSDLETLLKNFNELSAEEQHSLIAYLKKLEAREPQRVERLRQYVNAPTATTATSHDEPAKPAEKIKTVTIESDDDDYTVEDVFKTVNQKVKEDQIRQEMEIVKKSLEETKAAPPAVDLESIKLTTNIINNMSSGTDLFALVQASLQSTKAAKNNPMSVVSNTQSRSFGDRPELSAPVDTRRPVINIASLEMNNPQMNQPPPRQMQGGMQQGPYSNQGYRSPPRSLMDQGNFRPTDRDFHNQRGTPWERDNMPMNKMNTMDRGPGMRPSYDRYGPGPDRFNQGPPPRDNFMRGRLPDTLDSRPPINPGFGNQGNLRPQSNFGNQGNYGNQGKFDGNQGRFGGSQPNFGDRRGHFGGNRDNFGRNQDNFGRNQDGVGRNQDDFGRNQGRFGGNQNDYRGNQDDFEGKRDNIEGNQDEFRGNQNDSGINQDDFEGNQDNFGRNQDDFGGNQDDFGGNQDDFGGNQDDFDGNQDPFGNQDDQDDLGGNQDDLGGNQDDLEGNQNDIEANQEDLGGNRDFGGNLGNLGRNQGNFGRNQDSFGPNHDNFGRNQGRFGGIQSNFTENLEDLNPADFGLPTGFGGNRGKFGGNPDDLRGNHDKFGGSQGKFGGGQGNFGGSQGKFGGGQSNFGGSQGNFRGNPGMGGNFRGRGGRGNFGGPRGRGRGRF